MLPSPAPTVLLATRTESDTMAQTTLSTAETRAQAQRKPLWRDAHRATPYLFLVLPLTLYCIWVIGPMFYSIWMGFTNSDGISQQEFIGLDNYDRLIHDEIFWTSF